MTAIGRLSELVITRRSLFNHAQPVAPPAATMVVRPPRRQAMVV